MDTITSYHTHIYFNKDTVDSARELYKACEVLENVTLGRFHERNVGPHTEWSFMLDFKVVELAKVAPWLTMNRRGLSVLVHPCTDNDLKDHTEHAMWLGKSIELDLSIL